MSGESAGKIVLTADMLAVYREQEKVIAKQEQINEKVAGTGQAWIKVGSGIAGAITGAVSLGEVLGKSSKIMDDMIDKWEKMSHSKGSSIAAQAKAIDLFGFDAGTSQQLQQQTRYDAGSASDGERTGAIEGLAEFKRTSRRTISAATVKDYIRLVSSGLYSSEQLLTLIKRGQPLPSADEQAEKLERLGSGFQQENTLAAGEYASHIAAEDIAGATGRGAEIRISHAAREVYTEQNPVRAAVANMLPQGSTLQEYNKTPQAVDLQHQILSTLQQINNKTVQGKPKVNLSGQDGSHR